MIKISRLSLPLPRLPRKIASPRALLIYLVVASIVIIYNTLLSQTDIPDGSKWALDAVRPTGTSQSITISESATNQATAPAGQHRSEVALVKRVVDGDTFELEDGRRVRMIGINTRERFKPGGPECFAQEAYDALRDKIEGKEVLLTKDVSEVDKYKRLLRYVYLDNVFINDWLILEGYAQVSTFPPDVANQSTFLASQKLAKTELKGLWGGVCDVRK